MADPRLFRLRVTFRETGRLAMLSHLELARALERAVRRAQLPFAVSQGFSPHMRIAFGAALPVGVGGTAEIFDLFLTDYVPALRALAALQEASPADLYPTEARYIEARDAAASVALPVSTYEVVLSEAPGAIVVPEAITVVRKKKEKTLVPADFLVGPVSLDGATVRFSLEAKPTGSLRADAFARELIRETVAAGHVPPHRPARRRGDLAPQNGLEITKVRPKERKSGFLVIQNRMFPQLVYYKRAFKSLACPIFRHFQAISGKGGAKNGAIADLSLFSSQRGQMKV